MTRYSAYRITSDDEFIDEGYFKTKAQAKKALLNHWGYFDCNGRPNKFEIEKVKLVYKRILTEVGDE